MSFHEKLGELLSEVGLTEAEIMLYFELVQKPAATKWELVKRTGLNKNKIYRAFDQLVKFELIKKDSSGIRASTLQALVENLAFSQEKTAKLANKLKACTPFMKIPTETIEEFDIANKKDKILSIYMKMSEVDYDTCLDFGDLENFVPVLGGMDPVFKFRLNRYKQMAKNIAICTTRGPYTSCIARKKDLDKFKSNIKLLKTNFKGKWMVFSDTNDYVMFNDFADPEKPSAVLVKSKVIADTQRMQFGQFHKNLQKL